MDDPIMEPLPKLEDHVRRPAFIPRGPFKRFKQTDQVFIRALRGELGEELKKINITTPPPHPMDRTVFSPTMVRAHLWKGCEPPVFKNRVPVTDRNKMSLWRSMRVWASTVGWAGLSQRSSDRV